MNLPEVTIRPADASDADRLALIGATTFAETYAGLVDGQAIVDHCASAHTPDAYRKLLNEGAAAWLALVEPGSAPVGYAVTCEPDLEAAEPGDRELRRIYALSRFHGAGVGAALLDAAIRGSGDSDRLLVGVKNDNHRAISFYRKQGFEQIGTRTFSVACKSYDDFVLARPIAAKASQ